MSILSIQSHVAYGYVGNKAAVFPLQSMGYDVWPVNTVQFSNHTGYGKWQGEIFSSEHIRNIITGIEDIGVANKCKAILSGYMGSHDICLEVLETVARFKSHNPHLLYLCDPVIGNTHCFAKPEVLDFFKTQLKADIITPNQFEAEILSGIKIVDIKTLKMTAQYFHNLGISIVIVTGLKLLDISESDLHVFVSDSTACYLVKTKEYTFSTPINGTGDLFSAIYLGSYLATTDTIKALQTAVYYLDKALHNTFLARTRELQVPSVHYQPTTTDALPEFIKI